MLRLRNEKHLHDRLCTVQLEFLVNQKRIHRLFCGVNSNINVPFFHATLLSHENSNNHGYIHMSSIYMYTYAQVNGTKKRKKEEKYKIGTKDLEKMTLRPIILIPCS